MNALLFYAAHVLLALQSTGSVSSASPTTLNAGPNMNIAPPISSETESAACGSSAEFECNVVELRQYVLYPGKRDVLIELFDREFVEPQEDLGMSLLGQFRNLDNPDTFVWMRGFADMDGRLAGLSGFYGGPVWAAHREVANSTMTNSDNVLLLRPAWPGAGLRFARDRRAVDRNAATIPPGFVDITVFPLVGPADSTLLAFCKRAMTNVLARAGAHDIAWYVTEEATNNFPRLPVRTGEHVLVGVAVFPDQAHYDALVASGAWSREVSTTLAPYIAGKVQSMRLVPTARSALHE